MKKRFYLMGEHMCDANNCSESLANCPLFQTAHERKYECRMGLTLEHEYIYIENFREPMTTKLKDELTQICLKCKQRSK